MGSPSASARGAPRQRFEPREAAAALWAAKWDLGLPTLVVVARRDRVRHHRRGGGARGGLRDRGRAASSSATSTRSAICPRVLVDAAALVGAVLILLGTALGLTSWFVDARSRHARGVDEGPRRVARRLPAPLNAVLLVLGSVLEIYSAIVVLAPLVAPLGGGVRRRPVHLGVVFLANLELGFLFPPMGLNLFLAASRFGKPAAVRRTGRRCRSSSSWRSACSLITYLPAISVGVLAAFGGRSSLSCWPSGAARRLGTDTKPLASGQHASRPARAPASGRRALRRGSRCRPCPA